MWVLWIIFFGFAAHGLRTKYIDLKHTQEEARKKQERWKKVMRKLGEGQGHKAAREPKPLQIPERRVHFESESDLEEESWELNL